MIMNLAPFFRQIIYGKLDPEALPPDQERNVRYAYSIIVLMLLVGMPFLLRSIQWGLSLRIFCLGFGILVALLLLLCNPYRKNLPLVGNIIISTFLIAVIGAIVTGGGFEGPAVGWLWLLPVFAGFLIGLKSAVLWAVPSLLLVFGLYLLEKYGVAIPDLTPLESQLEHRLLHYLGIYGSGILVTLGFLASLRHSERRYKRLISQLEREVIQREQAQQDAQQASQAKSQFLANVSHELRTPMNAIIGMVQLMQGSALDETHQRQMQVIDHSGRFLLSLINDVLDLSKIEADRLELEVAPFLFDQIITDLAITMGFHAHERKLDFRVDIDPELPAVMVGDALRLSQVLMNLISNAIKFTDHGGVEVRMKLAEQSGDAILLDCWVCDTGIGMSDDYARSLFKPFSQADTSITRRYGGTGLGLAISKRLIDLMDGQVEVSSALRQGSTFHLRIPLKQAERVTGAMEDYIQNLQAVTRACQGQRATLVWADDHERHILQRLLTSFGFNVESVSKAPDSGQGIAGDWLILASGPDLPGLLQLKSERAEHTHILILSDAFQALSAPAPGAFQQLQRPVTRAQLLASLTHIYGTEAKPIQSETARASDALRDRVILLVEDNQVNQEVAKRILEKAGADVIVANNGREALQAIQARTFDAVLMDVQMPIMDGIEATRQIRGIAALRDIPILGMTAHVHQAYLDACLEAGMSACLTKPYRRDALIAAIQRWLKPNAAPST